MHDALVRHAQHDVDREHAVPISNGSLLSDCWNTCAVPAKPPTGNYSPGVAPTQSKALPNMRRPRRPRRLPVH